NASSSDVADGGPLFLDILKNWREESEKTIIASQIISFYAKLFNNYKDHQTIQSSIDIMREHMFMKFFNSFNSSDTKKHDFEKLIDLQVNDLTVQRKAVSELCHVVEDLWPTSSQRKRKRSQIQFRGRRASK
ncbi:Interferon gamma, partial [Galemys pyrenaicus]